MQGLTNELLHCCLQLVTCRVVTGRAGWHSSRYIYPAGFITTREFSSAAIKDGSALYVSKILDPGDVTGVTPEGAAGGAPVFVVTASDLPGEEFRDNSPSGAWNQVFRRVSELRGLKRSTGNGLDMFGLTNAVVGMLIQVSSGAPLGLG